MVLVKASFTINIDQNKLLNFKTCLISSVQNTEEDVLKTMKVTKV